MTTDFLEQLAQGEVPPIPQTFDRQVHQRLNVRLIALHLLDFAVRGLPYAMVHFTMAVLSLVVFTITGNFVKGETHDSGAN